MSFDHIVIAPRDQVGLHRQSTWELTYIIRGEGIRTIGNKTEPFCRGEIVLIVPNMPHQWRFNPSADDDGMIENISISFPSDLVTRIGTAFNEMSALVNWINNLDHSLQIPRENNHKLKSILWRMKREDEGERLLSLLQMLMEIWKSEGKRDSGHFEDGKDNEAVKRVINYIHCNFNREISIEQLALYTGINGTSLYTIFKQKTNHTIMQYVMSLRMDMVLSLLKNSDKTIAQICFECGFRDVPHFNRTFRKLIGMSPKEYKVNAKTNLDGQPLH